MVRGKLLKFLFPVFYDRKKDPRAGAFTDGITPPIKIKNLVSTCKRDLAFWWRNRPFIRGCLFGVVFLSLLGLTGIFSSKEAFADSTISMSISSNSVELNLVPVSDAGTFTKSSNLDISISLSGAGGYMLGIHSAASGANATNLVNTSDSTKVFTSISSTLTESNFSNASNTQYNNQWGYLPSKFNSQDNTSFHPAPNEDGDTLDQTSGTDETGTYTIAIGARADLDTTTGSYTGTYVITAIANQSCNPLANTISDALCMQDISGDNPNTDNVINSMEEGRQYKLKDNRDWKEYYIAKMKDGRVWMTQNLDLDLETTPTYVDALTHANTDLGWTTLDTTATWTPSTATATTTAGYGVNTSTTPASFNYGDVYRYVSTTGTTTSYSTKSACETAHADGTCPHYHVGNYYNWSAAIASNDTSSITTNYTTAPDSICPAGWRLPKGRTSATSTDTGYYSEINYTWVNEGLAQDYVTGTGTATYNPDNSTGWISIRNNSMYMVAAGHKNNQSNVMNLGTSFYYWTNTVFNSTAAHFFTASSSDLSPAPTNAPRGRGYSIRCIARQANTGSTTVTFDKNASDATGTMNDQTINADTFASLSANSFTRNGYSFKNWNTSPDGSGTIYADLAMYYAKTGTTTTNTTLYAQWDKLYTITFNVGSGASGVYFGGTTYTNGQTAQAIEGKEYQISGVFPTKYGLNSWTTTAGTLANSSAPTTTYTVVSNATITVTGKEATTNMSTLTNSSDPVSNTCKNDPVTPELVYDPRDNEAYYIARLCDGNIWMLDNLRLDLTNSTLISSLSSTNTNATDTQLNYLRNGGGTTSDQYPTSGFTASWSNTYNMPKMNRSGSVTAGNNGNTWTGSYTKDTVAPITYGVGSGKIGVYYNFCVASAGSFCYTSGNEIDVPSTYRDIEGDICPIGWRLPSEYPSGASDFNTLFESYNGATLGQGVAFRNALSLSLSGKYTGSANNQGSGGSFWTSTYNGASSMRSSGIKTPASYTNRSGGISVRCVFGGKSTVSFDKNASDATGTMSNQTVTGGTWIRINNGFTRTGYTLNSWNTEPDGSGTSYTDIYNVPDNASGNVTLYAIWDKVYTITFSVGSGATGINFDGATYTNGQTIQAIYDKEYQIYGEFPTKYGLDSWTVTAGTITNTSTPVTTYTVTNDATITLTSKEATTNMSSLTIPTDPVSSNCKNEAVIPQLVYDSRDNEAYYVARLCDGNIWMLDNLRLDLTNSTVINALSSTNTNATDTQLNYLKNGGGTTSDQYPISGLSGSEWTSSYRYSVPQVAARFKDDIAPVTFGLGTGKVGVYYNYCATSAGTYCWGNGTSSTGSPSSDPNTGSYRDIEGDICPAGWYLPTGTSSGQEFYTLLNAYSGGGTLGGQTTLTQAVAHNTALSTPLSGYISSGLQNNLGTHGYFWSSTWGDSYTMYGRYVLAMSIDIRSYGRGLGLPVRCMLSNV